MLVEGTAARDGIGNALDNVITGNAAHNGLVGGDGNDTLIGGLSDDAMFGGLGNDTYSVDNANDLVGEPFGGGFDTVRSSLPAYVLADTLELRRSSSTPARPGRSATQATTRSSATPSATT